MQDEHVLFYIPATSSVVDRRVQTLKHGDTFAVFDHFGDILGGPHSPEGIFHDDTRVVSSLKLLINGAHPILLSSTVEDNNVVLTTDLTNADILNDRGHVLQPRDTLHVSRSKFLWDGGCHERLTVHNYLHERQRASIRVLFDADYTDLFELRGRPAERHGERSLAVDGPERVIVSYHARDGLEQSTAFNFEPAPDSLSTIFAHWDLDLAPREKQSLFMCMSFPDARRLRQRQRRGYFDALRAARRALRTASGRAAAVVSSNEIFNEIARRSIADTYVLLSETEHGPYPHAGIPWFSVPFGRDGAITAIQLLWVDPEIARGVLRFQAATQARAQCPGRDADPGKIFHETRRCESARLNEIPFGMYYGSIDSTPLFVLLAGLYEERTGDMETVRELWPNIEAALGWIDTYGDRDGDGLVEYARERENGLLNQAWKDSDDSIFHADGTLARGPIAPVEVQGYVYAAKRHAARLARNLNRIADAGRLEQEASLLQKRFEAAFWSDELGTYVLALDGVKRQCAVRSSNAGQVLFSGIASPGRAARVAEDLMSWRFFSGWGIRTLASDQPRYNPMSYHNGSIWPHDNALIALGLAQYGHREPVLRIFEGLFDAVQYFDLRRYPELFCGFRRQRGKGPTLYPVSCSPQAWAAALPFALLQACLGLSFDPASQTIRLRHPHLPAFLDELRISRLRCSGYPVDLLVHRHGPSVSVNILAREGPIEVDVIV